MSSIGSDEEREVGSEHGDEQDVHPPDYIPPISALPPRVVLQEESQVEVSASPAFQCLDDVSN